MTLLDGHGRTPHDTWEQTQSAAAMVGCLPCLMIVAFIKFVANILPHGAKPRRMKAMRGNVATGGTEVELDTAIPANKEIKTSFTEPETSESESAH